MGDITLGNHIHKSVLFYLDNANDNITLCLRESILMILGAAVTRIKNFLHVPWPNSGNLSGLMDSVN